MHIESTRKLQRLWANNSHQLSCFKSSNTANFIRGEIIIRIPIAGLAQCAGPIADRLESTKPLKRKWRKLNKTARHRRFN